MRELEGKRPATIVRAMPIPPPRVHEIIRAPRYHRAALLSELSRGARRGEYAEVGPVRLLGQEWVCTVVRIRSRPAPWIRPVRLATFAALVVATVLGLGHWTARTLDVTPAVLLLAVVLGIFLLTVAKLQARPPRGAHVAVNVSVKVGR